MTVAPLAGLHEPRVRELLGGEESEDAAFGSRHDPRSFQKTRKFIVGLCIAGAVPGPASNRVHRRTSTTIVSLSKGDSRRALAIFVGGLLTVVGGILTILAAQPHATAIEAMRECDLLNYGISTPCDTARAALSELQAIRTLTWISVAVGLVLVSISAFGPRSG